MASWEGRHVVILIISRLRIITRASYLAVLYSTVVLRYVLWYLLVHCASNHSPQAGTARCHAGLYLELHRPNEEPLKPHCSYSEEVLKTSGSIHILQGASHCTAPYSHIWGTLKPQPLQNSEEFPKTSVTNKTKIGCFPSSVLHPPIVQENLCSCSPIATTTWCG